MPTIKGSQSRNKFNTVTFTIGSESSDTINVAVQVEQEDQSLSERTSFIAYLSGDAEGDGVVGTAPTGGVSAGTNGQVLTEIETDKVLLLKTNASGSVDIDLTDTGTPTFHLVVIEPDGSITASDAITFS